MRIRQLLLFLALTGPVKAGELDCLAKNIYFEAGGEPEAGQFMVGFITMNRVRDKRWPNSVCKVVYQPGQFSWTENKKLKYKRSEQILKIAKIVLRSKEIRNYGFYFKVTSFKSAYFRRLKKLMTVGNHTFYK